MDNNVNVVLLDKLSSRDFAVEIEKQKAEFNDNKQNSYTSRTNMN